MELNHFGRYCYALAAAILIPLLNGCTTYRPAPIDWNHEQENWTPQGAEPLELTLDELQLLAGAMNPEVQRIRLRHTILTQEALASGWWEDPALDLDVSRLLESGVKPWTIGGALVWTIPLTGIPGLERRAAEAYAEEGWFEVALAERKLAADIQAAWADLAAATRLLALQEAFAEEAAAMQKQAERLYQLGECTPEQAALIRRGAAEARSAATASRLTLPQKRAALLALAGIHPRQSVRLLGGEEQAAFSLAWLDDAQLTAHPAVQAKLMAFEATEQQFRAEIRRQYPEIALGPAVESDQGDWNGGLVFGIRLPLWNRNRAGIASAEGLRAEARQACLNTWRTLVHDSHRLQREVEALEAEVEILERVTLPDSLRLRAEIERMDQLGEADLFTRFEAAQAGFETGASQIELETRLRQTQFQALGELLAVPFSFPF